MIISNIGFLIYFYCYGAAEMFCGFLRVWRGCILFFYIIYHVRLLYWNKILKMGKIWDLKSLNAVCILDVLSKPDFTVAYLKVRLSC